MEALLAFAATLVSLRLTAELLRRHRARPAPELVAWAGSLAAFALGSGALAWGAAAGWDDRSFRVYYLFGGLLTAALLGAGSLLRAGNAWAAPMALLYAGLAVGVALAMPFTEPVTGSSIPEAQAHLELFPARALAIVGNGLGTIAAVAVALAGLRRRPVGNWLILAGVAVAALGSALAGLGEAETALFSAAAAVLLYAGFVAPSASRERPLAHPGRRAPTSASPSPLPPPGDT
ncbi:MAG: hypothetical protein ACXWZP_05235 [Gaiellaceae bacterium]